MAKTLYTPQYSALLQYLVAARKAACLTQQQLAERLSKPQSFVSKFEHGERRLDVVEFLAVARAIGIDPCKVIKSIERAALAPKAPHARTDRAKRKK